MLLNTVERKVMMGAVALPACVHVYHDINSHLIIKTVVLVDSCDTVFVQMHIHREPS